MIFKSVCEEYMKSSPLLMNVSQMSKERKKVRIIMLYKVT